MKKKITKEVDKFIDYLVSTIKEPQGIMAGNEHKGQDIDTNLKTFVKECNLKDAITTKIKANTHTFKLKTTAYTYGQEELPELKALGFTFEPYNPKRIIYKNRYRITNEPEITITSVQQLIDLAKQFGQIILSQDSIEIYNDYQ